ncbi:protein sarah [Chrysoperla carnea]|uniref:protein sarah n=1 Tax=Chrysoperla carnea TaxID=189513 RepID=UPI001D08273D|nr:protein sarah [Chrysoperla carnea]
MANSNSCDTLNNEDIDSNIIINELDGLPNCHPNLEQESQIENDSSDHTPNDFEDLPTSLIVTNIHDNVFANEKQKAEMEALFKQYGEPCTFQWLRSFRRLRVNFKSPTSAANARLQLHQYPILNSVITCYFAQPVTPVTTKNLQPPAPVKQFLISPPSSPPLDWEPRPENEPLVNHDLLAALATLAPGSSHELHSPQPGQPGIVVHTAAQAAAQIEHDNLTKPKIMHTRCPEF